MPFLICSDSTRSSLQSTSSRHSEEIRPDRASPGLQASTSSK